MSTHKNDTGSTKTKKADATKITIFMMGKEYKVAEGLSIHRALEAIGYKLLRGCGCRGGFCGACATVYRIPGDFRLKVGLACQTIIQEGMMIAQIPYFPANKADYKVEDFVANGDTLRALYPEISRCLQCGTCTKICPQGIQVKDYMAAAIKGDLKDLTEKSFNCIMCGLCAARCPAELNQCQVALLGRRLYGKYLTPKAEHLDESIKKVAAGEYEQPFKEIMNKDLEGLKNQYEERDIEK